MSLLLVRWRICILCPALVKKCQQCYVTVQQQCVVCSRSLTLSLFEKKVGFDNFSTDVEISSSASPYVPVSQLKSSLMSRSSGGRRSSALRWGCTLCTQQWELDHLSPCSPATETPGCSKSFTYLGHRAFMTYQLWKKGCVSSREVALSTYLIMTRGSIHMESSLSKQTCRVF